MRKIYIISGPCGCGKSTLAKELVNKLPNSVLIEGDNLHNIFNEKDEVEWLRRLSITWENIISVTRNCLKHNLDIVIDYVVEDELPLFISNLEDFEYELYYMVLTADEETIRKRITKRGDISLIERSIFLRNKLLNDEMNQFHHYDNSNKTLDEEITAILYDKRFLFEQHSISRC